MKLLRRRALDEQWLDRAECPGYDPEIWTVPEGDEVTARIICAEMCPVREDCLRRALRDDHTFGVMRGGIAFDSSHRVRCWRCLYPVANRKTGICDVCRLYDPCLGDCGRMVGKESDSMFCIECKVKEEEVLV